MPFNNYHLVATAKGFGAITRDATIDTGIPVTLKTVLQVGGEAQNITGKAPT